MVIFWKTKTMSCFPGLLEELPFISIDRFDRENLRSTCFFLSHCHTDHMQGLGCGFAEFLRRNEDVKLYCSAISRIILLNSENYPKNQIIELFETNIINVPCKQPYTVTVSAVPAGHCPGSVMFLFETLQERILYTGDFRIAIGDIKKFKIFHCGETKKEIDKVYLDSTFFSPHYYMFPSRRDSFIKVANLIEAWFDKSCENIAHIVAPANYGYENMFGKLTQFFKCSIFVKEHIYNNFWNVPEIGIGLTTNPDDTKIHVCDYKKCNFKVKSNILHIRVAAMWYRTSKDTPLPSITRERDSIVHVCYATHSSYSELVDFLMYLQPKDVQLCTKVPDVTESQLKELMSSWSSNAPKTENNYKKEYRPNMSKSPPFKLLLPTESRKSREASDLVPSPPPRTKRLQSIPSMNF